MNLFKFGGLWNKIFFGGVILNFLKILGYIKGNKIIFFRVFICFLRLLIVLNMIYVINNRK